MMGHSSYTYTRICMDCGKIMHNVGRSRKRCAECGRRHHKALRTRQRKEALDHQRREVTEKQSSANRSGLHADALAARQAGMSYGKYMLLKSKKPAGAATPTSSKG